MIGIFKPSPEIPRLPADKIDPTYRRLRWQVFIGIFLGYAAYYFTRGNFDLAQKGLIDAGLFNKEDLGKVGAAALGFPFFFAVYLFQVADILLYRLTRYRLAAAV